MMRYLFAPLALTIGFILGGCMADDRAAASAESEAGLASALAGKVAEAPTSCLPPGPALSNTKAYGKVLLYTYANGDIYANQTSGGCEDRGGNSVFVQVEHQGRACSGDFVRVFDSGSRIPTGACALGQFTPYRKTRP